MIRLWRYAAALLLMLTAFTSAAPADEYLNPITVPLWEGGGVDGDADGKPDFCQVAKANASGGALMALWVDRGLVLALIEASWALTRDTRYDITLAIGPWQQQVTGLGNNAATLVYVPQTPDTLLAALKSSDGLTAKGAIGAFDITLENGPRALEQLEDCYRVHVAGLAPNYAHTARQRTAS